MGPCVFGQVPYSIVPVVALHGLVRIPLILLRRKWCCFNAAHAFRTFTVTWTQDAWAAENFSRVLAEVMW